MLSDLRKFHEFVYFFVCRAVCPRESQFHKDIFYGSFLITARLIFFEENPEGDEQGKRVLNRGQKGTKNRIIRPNFLIIDESYTNPEEAGIDKVPYM
jgi:hypothetical protein